MKRKLHTSRCCGWNTYIHLHILGRNFTEHNIFNQVECFNLCLIKRLESSVLVSIWVVWVICGQNSVDIKGYSHQNNTILSVITSVTIVFNHFIRNFKVINQQITAPHYVSGVLDVINRICATHPANNTISHKQQQKNTLINYNFFLSSTS